MFLVMIIILTTGAPKYFAIDNVQEWYIEGSALIVEQEGCGSFKFRQLLKGTKTYSDGSGLVFLQMTPEELKNLEASMPSCPLHQVSSLEEITMKYYGNENVAACASLFSNRVFGARLKS